MSFFAAVFFICDSTAVEELCNEGHLYSTIDDNHFKSTGSRKKRYPYKKKTHILTSLSFLS